MARGLKIWIEEVEELYYPCSENKGTDQLFCYAKPICVVVFAYVKIWFSHVAKSQFSHDAAQIIKFHTIMILGYWAVMSRQTADHINCAV